MDIDSRWVCWKCGDLDDLDPNGLCHQCQKPSAEED